jgi:hypothetical protein
MSYSVPVSDDLIRDAQQAAQARAGSVDDQIERWARLGRAVERVLSSGSGGELLSHRLATVDSDAGRQRVTDVLRGRPFPHYESAPDAPGVVIRTDKNGTQTRGRFVGRQFRALHQ